MFRIRDHVSFFSRFSNESSGHGLWTSGNKMSADPPPDMSGHPPTRRHFLRHVQFNHLVVKLSDAKMISQTCPNNTMNSFKGLSNIVKIVCYDQ